MKKRTIGVVSALKYAYRHTWGSGRTGFLDALGDGMNIYNVYEEIIAVVAFGAAIALAYYVGKYSN
jgi:hypothetical protein